MFLTLLYSSTVTTTSTPEITPLEAKQSSTYLNFVASNCIDGNYGTMCHTDHSDTYPWVTLVIPHSIVRKIRMKNRWNDHATAWKRLKNVKIWVGNEFPSTTKVEYTKGALLGSYVGPASASQVVEITSKTGVKGTHVVVQMETQAINLMEIEVFGEPARCIDTGCKKTEGVEAECVYLKNVNWTSISHIYNVSTPWKEGLCKGADLEGDCCKCLPRLPVGCVDVKDACKDSFGGFGVCKNFVKDDMSTIDFEQGSKKGLCNMDQTDCCECFSLKKTMTTKP